MAGTIGLCNSGKWLDRQFETMTDKHLVYRITKFIQKFSKEIMGIHRSHSKPDNILLILREHYKLEATTRFSGITASIRIGIHAYIHALTKPNFTASTKTQQGLRVKAVVHALSSLKSGTN
jgi:hypothetical protein